jgi:IclR family transcriptional regulator, acetate operon repressor
MDSLGTVDKAVDVLLALHAAPAPQGVSALGRTLGLPRSSTHRLLATLARRGLVERDPEGRYRPGITLVALGVGVLERDPLWRAARPLLEAEAQALGETVFLVAPRAGRLLVLDKVEGTGFLRAAPQVGAEVPVHATAVGKLFLAFAPERVGVAPGAALQRFTPQTLRSRRALAEAVAAARASGWAENRDEWVEGLYVVAAPIRVRDEMRAALAVAAPTPRMRELGAATVARRTCAAALRIGTRLEAGEDEVGS